MEGAIHQDTYKARVKNTFRDYVQLKRIRAAMSSNDN